MGPPRAELLRRGWRQAVWRVTSRCDLACSYCRSARGEEVAPDAGAVARVLGRHGGRWVVGITGGEPLTVPDLPGVCETLGRRGLRVVLDSNLNDMEALEALARGVSPETLLEVHATLHATEVPWPEGAERFAEGAALLRGRGVRVTAVSVLHPSPEGVERFRDARRLMARRGVELRPKPFKGRLGGREYPEAYSDQQLALIIRRRPFVRFYPFPSRGLWCAAGSRLVQITERGQVTRCVGDMALIGHLEGGFPLARGPLPCRVERCPCFGHDLLAGGGLAGAARAWRRRWALHARVKGAAALSLAADVVGRRLGRRTR